MSDRKSRIVDGIERAHLGIEVAPWFNPLVAKRDGYSVRVIDVFDRDTLLERAAADPTIPKESLALLEEVDFVGSATEIAALVPQDLHGKVDYVVSSHNFEHLPNPIKFLQGCERILKPGGMLSMAVPDHRNCFDYFRPHTLLGEWLEAYFEDRRRPTSRQVFEYLGYGSSVIQGDSHSPQAFRTGEPAENVLVHSSLTIAFEHMKKHRQSESYHDAHCTIVCPSSLELLLVECRQLGLISLQVESISDPSNSEIYVRLRSTGEPAPQLPDDEFNEVRSKLMRRIIDERAYRARSAPTEAKSGSTGSFFKSSLKGIVGHRMAGRLRSWNARRLAKRRQQR